MNLSFHSPSWLAVTQNFQEARSHWSRISWNKQSWPMERTIVRVEGKPRREKKRTKGSLPLHFPLPGGHSSTKEMHYTMMDLDPTVQSNPSTKGALQDCSGSAKGTSTR